MLTTAACVRHELTVGIVLEPDVGVITPDTFAADIDLVIP